MGALTFAIALVVGVTAGCGSDSGNKADQPTTTTTAAPGAAGAVRVTATEYSFDAPAQVSGGLVDLTLTNTGKEAHEAIAVQLAPGKTLADYEKYSSETNPTGPPPGTTVAGVTGIAPGSSGHVAFKAGAGNYLWACFLPGADGIPHIAKGMVQPFTVAGDNAKAVPAATATVQAQEFAYPNLPALKAGTTTFTFENKGTQDHEAQLLELAPGKTIDDVKAFASSATPSGPPPFTFASGTGAAQGLSATATVTLDPARSYVFACFVPDPADGRPHITKGMVAQVKVTS
jgi:uncharacterized cupredoxin-like copper-binding protein